MRFFPSPCSKPALNRVKGQACFAPQNDELSEYCNLIRQIVQNATTDLMVK